MGRHLEAYTKARGIGGWEAERRVWKDCCRELNFVVDWRTPDNEEASMPLRTYDPKATIEGETLSAEDTIKKAAILDKRDQVSNESHRAECRQLLTCVCLGHSSLAHNPGCQMQC